ncbi:hypothetical protein EC900091_5269, partial [Escherichia coli 90.0091]
KYIIKIYLIPHLIFLEWHTKTVYLASLLSY